MALKNKIPIFVLFVLFLTPLISSALSTDRIDINGYFSFEYEKNISGDPEGDTKGSFDSDLFDLVLNFRLTDNVRIATDITWEHGTATEDAKGNAAVEYAFAEYTFSDTFKVRAGKMFTYFSIYNEIHTAKPATLTVKEPLSTNKNNKLGSEFRFYPRWNNGIAATGNLGFDDSDLDYVVQVLNGDSDNDGENPYEEDNNTHKAVNARLRYYYSDNLSFGLSLYTDKMLNADYGEVDIFSLGATAEWSSDSGLGLEFEFVDGSEDYLDGDTEISRHAYSAMIFYNLNERFTPYFRYEYLDPDSDVDGDTGTVTILGVNILLDQNVYLKMEVDRFDSGDANNALEGASYSEFKASVSIGF